MDREKITQYAQESASKLSDTLADPEKVKKNITRARQTVVKTWVTSTQSATQVLQRTRGKGTGMMAPRIYEPDEDHPFTLNHFLDKVVATYPDRPSLALVDEEPFAYAEFGERVETLRQTLRQLGFKRQDRAVILGGSSPNWATAFMAITTMGAVAVPVLEDFHETDIDHILRHSEASAIFIAENLYQSLNLPALKKLQIIIKLDDFSLLSKDPQEKSTFWKQLTKPFDKQPEPTEVHADDLAEILYTSGTTGHSKGVMLTQKNLVSNLMQGPEVLQAITPDSIVLSILPLSHAYGSTCTFLSAIAAGASVYFLNKKPSPKVLLGAMQKVRPTILTTVPLVFEKIYHKQVAPTIAKNRLMQVATKSNVTQKLLHKIIGKKVLNLLGGRLDCVVIGGAALSPDVETFMANGGIPFCCGYGLSEASPLVAASSPDTRRYRSSGYAIPGVKIKIADADPNTGIGEIHVKGPNIMQGYYKNPEETEKVLIDNGWLVTGDRGYLDNDGYLYITGRSKNVIVGPSGENIYPEIIEAKLKSSMFVEETLVYKVGKQLVARIYPDYAFIVSTAGKKGQQDIAGNIANILETVRREVNTELPGYSQITRIIEQSTPFITTPTHKIKRVEYVPGYLKQEKK